ncbi:5-bromo-4-chloroindolyl phosphate hydrolysis family protein [Abiotrophia defectiva]|uniref:5-bromo-4-chloroindolyl phosphate hydrolysis family protein n=1 Tax=Abiotrophia defectiva TaxID=46125 RepID=UPI0028E5BFA4|nr:5-bromo-4-chloroindolyl phosphate hydrolysis family protein [Abiotrophia defectiva]
MWLPGQLIIVSPLIITSLVLHLAYRNLDFSSRLAAYKKSIQRRAGIGIGLFFVLNFLFKNLLTGGYGLATRLVLAFILYGLGLLILATGFQLINKLKPADWVRYFFYIGIACTILAVNAIVSGQHMDFEWVIGLIFLELFGLACVTGLVVLAKFAGPNEEDPYKASAPHSSSNKVQHYRQAGLSDQEIQFLREQLATAKPQIQSIEQEFNQNAKLRTLEVRYNTVKVCQNYFKDIVNQPKRLVEASDFLYKYLPSLEDILKKYNEINGHVAKNKQTYMILEKSAATIEKLCQSINDAYVNFHQEDLKAMEDELYVANRTLKSQEALQSDESVEDIINLGKDEA